MLKINLLFKIIEKVVNILILIMRDDLRVLKIIICF